MLLVLGLGPLSAANASLSVKTKMLGNTLQVITKNTGRECSPDVQVVVNCIVKFKMPNLPWYVRDRVRRRFTYSLASGERVVDEVYVCESRSESEDYGGEWSLEGTYVYNEDYGPSEWCRFDHYHSYTSSR